MKIRLLAFLLLMSASPGAARADADTGLSPNPMIDIAYVEPSDPALHSYYEALKARKVLEELSVFLTALRLPKRIAIQADQCGVINKLYVPGEPVVICYEYVAKLNELAAKIPEDGAGPLGVSRSDAVLGGFVQAALQHTASAVFVALNSPIWGREQDAADRLSGFLMLQFGPKAARKLINGAAYFYAASDRTWNGVDFAAVDSTESQRYYNFLCIAYGFDPGLFGDVYKGEQISAAAADLLALPARRVPWCPKDYADARWAFDTLILPHVDPRKMKLILERDWLNYKAD